jgi:hypothetical protein
MIISHRRPRSAPTRARTTRPPSPKNPWGRVEQQALSARFVILSAAKDLLTTPGALHAPRPRGVILSGAPHGPLPCADLRRAAKDLRVGRGPSPGMRAISAARRPNAGSAR